TNIYTVPVSGGAVTCRTTGHPADDQRPRYSPDGKYILYGMTHDPEFYADRVRLMRMDRATGQHEEWLGTWDFTPAHWEYAGDGTVVFEAEYNARMKLFTWSGVGEPRALTTDGSVSGVTPVAGGRIAFLYQTLVTP